METVTEILIDFSGSMKDKLPLIKQVLLNDVIPNLDYSSRIGIKTFAGNKDQPPTFQILNLNLTNKEAIVTAINSLGVPDGGTPITAAIRASANTLKEFAANDKKIILVTDGEEDKGGDYVTESRKIGAEGVNCQIHIIGIGLNSQAQSQALVISKLTNGSVSYIPFSKGTSYNSTNIKSNLSPLYNSIKQTPIVNSSLVSPVSPLTVKQYIIETPKASETAEVSKEPKIEIVKQKPESEEGLAASDALKFIIEEIKNIKEQLKELKTERPEIPEIVENAEHNEEIRKASEEYINEILKKKYPDRVKWLNENGESKQDHDFEILELDGSIEYYIECKGTVKNKPTFYMTKNEWWLFLNHTKNYQIYFVKNSFSAPSHIFIDNLFDWLLKGKLVPYLKERDVIKEERVFLTLNEIIFD